MNCIACGEPCSADAFKGLHVALCPKCLKSIISGSTAALMVIEQIETRMNEIIAENVWVEGQLEEHIMNCRCDEQGMIAKYEAQKVPDYAGSIPHHPRCECDHCIN